MSGDRTRADLLRELQREQDEDDRRWIDTGTVEGHEEHARQAEGQDMADPPAEHDPR